MNRSIPPEPLPLVPGPKLPPFTRTARATIEFIEELGNPAQDLDGLVWKVKIGGKEPYYALKMFPFNLTEYLVSGQAIDLVYKLASAQLYSDYFDPFNCECRVYGRLKQEDREDLAVRAHGYLFLTPEQAAEVEERTSMPKYPEENEQDGVDFWGRDTELRHLPVRAIVKELVSPQDPFTPEAVPQIWDDLEDLHKLGILVRDINTFNYMGGKIIDFSRAWTTPHPFPAAMGDYTIKRTLKMEPLGLQKAFIEWGLSRNWDWDIIPEEMMRCTRGEGRDGPYGTDPSLYDWWKWEKDPDAADAFMASIFEDAENDPHSQG
ncbi:kinetochore Sim4 complex subunit FTA2-domain-containing protein [Chaetomium sp. MPI-CAGE-AT-0009]|nr:kinetochore Sim4 complex subunit FTA2-domain-containing protein [Chaetomium sp. MPI-CAGE-AT-0009]